MELQALKGRPRPLARWAVALLSLLLGAAIVFTMVPSARASVLRCIGEALVAEDPVTRADVIAIANDARGAGVLEASDLVQSGIANHVILFRLPSNPVGREFARRGIAVSSTTDNALMLLGKLGISQVEVIPWPVTGTEDEARMLQRWCAQRQIHSLVFISTSDHSRRTRRILHRALDPLGVQVALRYSRYSDFDPRQWWESREGLRTGAIELQKLLVDLLRHPLS